MKTEAVRVFLILVVGLWSATSSSIPVIQPGQFEFQYNGLEWKLFLTTIEEEGFAKVAERQERRISFKRPHLFVSAGKLGHSQCPLPFSLAASQRTQFLTFAASGEPAASALPTILSFRWNIPLSFPIGSDCLGDADTGNLVDVEIVVLSSKADIEALQEGSYFGARTNKTSYPDFETALQERLA